MPFFDSLTSQLPSTPDMFSLQLCGVDTSSPDELSTTMDGLMVCNQTFVKLLLMS